MPRLTEQEQQEIIRCLEADRPLPEKYRFLLFDDKREVELVWNGKTNEVCNLVLPFQTIEQVDEPRAEKQEDTDPQLSLFDERGRQLQGWTNKLIWGDNKLILSSLKNGPIREEIEKQGGLKLIYIDPPFDVGADFSMDIEIGDETFTKKPNILEEIAYRDTWGKGQDSFLAMLYERLILMKGLLSSDGSIYVHCDSRVNSHIRLILNEVFGSARHINEITWKRRGGALNNFKSFGAVTDTIFLYSNSEAFTFNTIRTKDSEDAKNYIAERFVYDDGDGRLYSRDPVTNPSSSATPSLIYEYKGYRPPAKGWAFSKTTMEEWDKNGKLYFPPNKDQRIRRKTFLSEYEGQPIQNLWSDIHVINSQAAESLGYPTQKPESLLERILKVSSNEGDLVADFFCGSGTTAAVAEKLGRKWICTDLGKFGIHTTRKRMIGVQRALKAEGKDFRAFEILNLGRYERQHYVGVNPNLREKEKQQQLEKKEAAFVELILRAYKAESVDGFECFVGKKAGRLVAIGPVNLPVTRLFVEEIILEARKKRVTKVDILGFEFEMGLFPNVLDEARGKGIDIAPKFIPADVFDKRAVERGQVSFHDVAAIEVKPIITPAKKKGGIATIAIQLTDFSVFYSQGSNRTAEEKLKNKSSMVIVDKGQIVKVSKDAKGAINRERLTQKWTDWIDYWAVDFNYENKREIIRVTNPDTNEIEERWTGEYVFENEWQSFRTKSDRSLELTSVPHECSPGRRKVAIKVVDIFGNDTMTIIDVNIEGKK
jgi:adenine-specific DNA-methyltransferase